jgi:methylated-DNA-[protein]-cysteine S-methyltransferase
MTAPVEYTFVDTPVGRTMLAWRGEAVTSIRFGSMLGGASPGHWRFVPGAVNDATRQLQAYFAGELRVFDLELAADGTEFQRRVWRAVAEIPYGETRSYAEIAEQIGNPAAVRAVGAANGRNDIPIVIPCHRVIGSDGGLCGYAGGVGLKGALLTFERLGYWDASLVKAPPV